MSTYEISKSSLLSLKAEILRKQEELSKVKNENDRKINLIRKNTPLEFKKKNTSKIITEDGTKTVPVFEDDEELLKKSRHILEKKSALYEKLRSGNLTKEEKLNKAYLVRFTETEDVSSGESAADNDSLSDDDFQLSEDETTDPAEKWVDYVDCLGRTRKCLQKDLEYFKTKDNDLKKTVEAKTINTNVVVSDEDPDNKSEKNENDEIKDAENVNGELLSSDMRREVLRQQWEKEEEDLRNKTDIHYQDVLFAEARTHGVGYYGFSKDGEERLKQQEALKQLREETIQKQKRAQELKEMREKQLAARMKAAKDRRRARLGLPPEEEEPVPSSEPIVSEEEKQRELEYERQKEEKEKLLDDARQRHIRPWDVGKDGVSKEHYEMTQKEWNELKRSERIDEFAPPTTYRNNKKTMKEPSSNSESSNDHSKQNKRIKKNKKWQLNKSSPPTSKNVAEDETNIPQMNVLNRPFRGSMANFIQENEKIGHSVKRQGVEIPPPMSFEYFGSTSSKIPRINPDKNDINESIEAGLKFLRKQMENKKQTK